MNRPWITSDKRNSRATPSTILLVPKATESQTQFQSECSLGFGTKLTDENVGNKGPRTCEVVMKRH